jgi:hypothetical protein
MRVSFKRAFCIIYLLSILSVLSGQNYPFTEYTVRDGLPHNQVSQITQDSRGFIWIVTRNGISRFDGVEFRNYFRKDGLLSNVNTQIFEDNTGNVWVLASNGLSKYDGYGFKSFPYSGNLKPGGFTSARLLNDTIFLIIPNQKPGKILWFDGENFHDYSQKFPVLVNLNVNDLNYEKSTGYYYLHDADGTWKWKYGSLTFLADQGMHYRVENGRLLFFDKSGYYLPGGDDGPVKISTEELPGFWYDPSWTSEILINNGGTTSTVQLPFPGIPFIDREKNLWLHSEMNMYRLVSTAFSYLSAEDGLPPSTWAIAEDATGRFWFGSLFGELMKYEGNRFIPQEYYQSKGLSNPGFYKGSIRQSNGDVLFTTNIGVFKWDGKAFSTIPELLGTQVCVSYEDPVDKSVLFGTDAGLFHLKNGKMDIYPEFSSPGLGVVEGIAADGEGRYWLSGQKGIVLHDRSGSVRVIDPALPEGYTYTIIKDSFGGIWVSSEEGLFVKPDYSSGFRDGLPPELNTTANVVAEMDSLHLIIGRNLDICIIDLQKFHSGEPSYFKIYDSSSGYPGNDCLDHGIVKDRNGKFWILTAGKVVILDPEKLKTNNNPPALHLTDISCQSDMQWEVMEVPGLFYGKAGTVKLTHRQNSLKFSFAGISMSDPLKVTYQFRLLGNGELWSAKSSSREAAFSNLPPGKYEFQLMGFNSDGVVSPEPLSFKFTIIPAFWQRIMFKAGLFLLIALILVRITIHIVRKNIRRKAEEDEIKNELTRLQMSSIFKQFEPHFTYNVISSAGSLILNGERAMAYDYLVKFSELLRSILTDGSMIIRTLAEEIKFVTNYCELQEMRFKERLSWHINIDEDVDITRQVPGMTIQTFVENSIKHGFGNRVAGGSISIDISEDNGSLVIKITDDGIGRKAAEQVKTGKSGHGLKTILSIYSFMNRMNRENATIEIDDLYDGDNNPAGTAVTIKIPDDYTFKPGKYVPVV